MLNKWYSVVSPFLVKLCVVIEISLDYHDKKTKWEVNDKDLMHSRA